MLTIHKPTMINAATLNPAAYNPRAISADKWEALKESMRADGFVEPLVVQKKGLKIIGGHQRLKAVKELCIEASEALPELPCIVLDIDDKRAKKLNIKLNKIKGDFEARMLGELLIDIYDKPVKLTEPEALSLGFTQAEALDHIYLIEPRPETDRIGTDTESGGGSGTQSGFGRTPTLSLDFDSVTTRDKVKKLLAEQVKVVKKKTGDIIASILFPRKPALKKAKKRSA